jgi:hypothetical protein
MATIPYTTDPARTVLGLVQAFCRSSSLPVPGALDGTGDAGALQLRELLQEVGDFCCSRGLWDFNRREVSWTSTGVENQGTIPTRAPDGFIRILAGTFWDVTVERPIYGPVGDEEWTVRKLRAASIDSIYRLQLNAIHVWPILPASRTLRMVYRSNHWLSSPSQISHNTINDETDFVLIPKDLALQGLEFFWRRKKELPYALEEQRFFDTLSAHMSGNSTSPVLHMDGEFRDPRPGIVVPQGNWLQL